MVSIKVRDQQISDNFNDLRYAPAKAVGMGEALVKLRKTQPLWTVIEAIMQMWSSTNPQEYQSFLVDLDFTKADGKVTSIGNKRWSNVSKSESGLLRHRLDIPVKVVYMIRRLYSTDECPMDSKFYDEWSRRFPKTVVSELK